MNFDRTLSTNAIEHSVQLIEPTWDVVDATPTEHGHHTVGRSKIDIYNRVLDDERTVVIENQLSDSDHDRLGKPAIEDRDAWEEYFKRMLAIGQRFHNVFAKRVREFDGDS